MRALLVAVCLAIGLAVVAPVLADGPAGGASLDAQYKAAQLDAGLANIRLGLVSVQMRIHNGQLAEARQELARLQDLFKQVEPLTDLSAYRQVADRLAKEVSKAADTQRRLAELKDGPSGLIPPEPAHGPGYGNPKTVGPTQPGLSGQADLAAGLARSGQEHAHTNVPGTPYTMTTDPAVLKQRALDHQKTWDEGRYAPVAELIDVGALLELDRARVHYQNVLYQIRDGARRDELLHVVEASIPPPHVMNYPSNWKQIEQARAAYAEGRLWQSPPFKDADGKEKTVAVYDVSDLLFVPIFPGPAEYNVTRPADPLRFWVGQERMRDMYVHPPYSFFGPGYNDPVYGVPFQGGNGGPATGPAAGSRYGIGGYTGYRVTDVIGSAYYFPYEADPIYQYRLAVQRAKLLDTISRMMSTVQD